MLEIYHKRKDFLFAIGLFALFSAWWLILRYINNPSDFSLELFSGTYGSMALFGAISGIVMSRHWGGYKSYMGRAVLMFALGLLAQEFGQITYSLYTLLLDKEIPYPSIGDLGYFGSIPLYIYGVWLLSRVSGVKVSLQSYGAKMQALLIPAAILVLSYWMFLREYQFDWSQPLTVFLDFGYPLGQAIYISLAILAYTLSRKFLGGVMRPVILFVLFALVIQYVADFSFVYQNNNGTWVTAGINDYTYLVAYFVMSLALLRFGIVAERMRGQDGPVH